jgi:hypothetical protein
MVIVSTHTAVSTGRPRAIRYGIHGANSENSRSRTVASAQQAAFERIRERKIDQNSRT